MKKIRLAIIGPDTYPIPAIRGGAIETGVTNILDLNEKEKKLDITVYTVCDKDLSRATKEYKQTRFVQIDRSYWTLPLLFIFKIFNRLFRYPWRPKSAYMHRINQYLKREQYDVIQFSTGSVEVAALSNKINSKIKYVVASDYLSCKTPSITHIVNRVDMFASNEYIIDRIISMLNVKKENTFITVASINTNLPSNDVLQSIRARIRKKHGISKDDVVIIYVGRLSPEKGSLELIKAVKQTNNCKLIIVGGANFSSNKVTDYVQLIQKESEDCTDRIIFTGYVKSHDDVVNYMFAADIACVPSICNEAGSIALLEFRAAGLPTVVSDKGGMKHHAAKDTIFVKCDNNYVRNLAKELQRIVDDSDYRKKLAMTAREGIEKHSLDKQYERFYQSINQLVNS